MYPTRSYLPLVFALLAACAQTSEEPGAAEADQTAWNAPAEGSCEAKAIQKLANEASLEELDEKLDRRAAENIVAGRPFDSLRAIDDVSGVGGAALSTLLESVKGACSDRVEIGIVSDLDKTVIPESKPDLAEAPYPGVKALLQLLEHRNGGAAGDLHYVTARVPEKIADVPAYLEKHGVPPGSYETGKSGVPWVAQAEKVRDISGIFQRTGTQRFVLLGDTAHRDPEAYKEILAAHPDRVIAAFIHKVDAKVPPERVEGLHLHEGYAEVAAKLYKLDVITRDEALGVMQSARDEGLAITDAQMKKLLD